MQLPKLIATDLDGTLLAPDGQVSERTRAALATARTAGVELVAATGRSSHTALPKLTHIDAIRWVVCSNGAVVWDRETGTVHRHRPIDGATASDVIAALRRAVDGVAIGWETRDGFGFDERFLQRPASIDELALSHELPEPDASTDVIKLLVTLHHARNADELSTLLLPHFPPTVTAAHSGGAFLETTAAGVDKATTLAGLAADLGVDAGQVMAFGDQHNDLPMLEWAGTGVAMDNAHANVRSAADAHAPSNAHDGVAAFIEDLLGV